MSFIRFFFRVIGLLSLLAVGLFIAFAFYAWLSKPKKDWILKFWSACLMFITGVRLEQEGEPLHNQVVMLVANHVSWIDIFIINAQRATSFVAKAEIRSWPVVGWLVHQVGTIFIVRGHRQAAVEINKKMAELFEQGVAVGLFPEGTTSEGFSLLPIKYGLLEGALRARVPIQPVCLIFKYKGERSGHVAFVGEQTLVANIWILLSSRDVSVTVRFLPPVTQAGVEPTEGRNIIGARVEAAISAELARG